MEDMKQSEKIDIEGELRGGKSVWIYPQGYSMFPFLRPGKDRVFISPVTGGVRRGDIVLYRRPGDRLVLHRICKIRQKDDTVFTIGDNQTKMEGPIPADCLLGVVTDIYRGKRHCKPTTVWKRCVTTIWIALIPFRPVILVPARKLYKVCRDGAK